MLRLEGLATSQSTSLKIQNQIDLIDGQIKDWIIAVQAKIIDPPPQSSKRIKELEKDIIKEIEILGQMTNSSEGKNLESSDVEKLFSYWHKLRKERNEDGLQTIPPLIAKILDEIYSQEVAKIYEKDPLITRNINLLVFFTMLLSIAGFFVVLTALRRIQSQNKIRQKLLIQLQISQQEAVESSILKSNFLATMGHEIRTPLNGIIGLTEILINDYSQKDQKYFLELIAKSGKSLLKITNDILDYSKVESGKILLNLRTFSIEEMFNHIKDTSLPKSTEKKLFFSTEIHPDMPKFFIGDREKLSLIILNLVNNAIKFTSQGGVILSCCLKNESSATLNNSSEFTVRFQIQDTGIGLSPEEQKHLFIPFVQLEQRGTQGEPGSGLGLSIAQSYAGLMNSQIKVESIKGVGSLFYFEIKLIPTQNPHKVPQSNISNDILQKKIDSKNILVVEDNITNQIVAQTFLEQLAMKVTLANNGQIALDYFKAQHNFELIFMDLNMPVMDGITCVKEIRKLNSVIPIVGLTANLTSEQEMECFNVGFNYFLLKPMTLDSTIRTLNFIFHEQAFVYTFFDQSKIKKLRQTLGQSQLKKVFLAFLQDLNDCLSKDKSLVEWEYWSHKLKSSASLIGAENLAKLLNLIENSSTTNAELISMAEIEMQLIKSILEQYLQNRSDPL